MSRMKLDCGAAAGIIFWRGHLVAIPQQLQCVVDPLERRLAAQHLQRLKQRRRVFTPAHRDANRLEHLAGFDLQALARRPGEPDPSPHD